MSSIRHTLGICPQHSVLWDELTVQEHLRLFGALKGVKEDETTPSSSSSSPSLSTAVADAIAEVQLNEKTHTLSSNLSGGQQRRLR
jgi:ABC-type multidrug transport system ATPase subunit